VVVANKEIFQNLNKICDCEDKYTIEDDTLYYGRCNHKHGYNLCKVSDKSFNMLDILNNEGDYKRGK